MEFCEETGRRKGGELALCLRELRDRVEKGSELTDWELERKEFFEMREVEIMEMGKQEDEGGELWKIIEKKERELQDAERWGRIRESRYDT